MLLTPQVWLAFGWYGLSSCLWLYILIQTPLSRAYPFALLGAALVPLLAWLVLGEQLTARYWVGSFLVLIGLFVAVGELSVLSIKP